MANKALLKATTTTGKVPTSADIVLRELAVNTTDGLLFMLKSDGSTITVNPPNILVYNGTTVYKPSTLARYVNSGVTDTNGRVAFNLTKDGTSTGTAIFSKIFSCQGTAVGQSTTDVTKYPHATIESITAKILTVRLMVPTAVLIGGNTMGPSGSGFTVYVTVEGAQ